jgi:hypothetical protein
MLMLMECEVQGGACWVLQVDIALQNLLLLLLLLLLFQHTQDQGVEASQRALCTEFTSHGTCRHADTCRFAHGKACEVGGVVM